MIARVLVPAAIVLMLATLPAVPVCGSEATTNQPAEIENAALVYWQSFALLPNLSEKEVKLLAQIEANEQRPSAASAILRKSQTSLGLVQHVSAKTQCEWQLIANGPATLLPHLGKARLLGRLLVVSSRVAAEEKRFAESIDQLAQALILARNVDEGSMVALLVGEWIEALAIQAASNISDLDSESVQQLRRMTADLPNRLTFHDAIKAERDLFVPWLAKIDALEPGKAKAVLEEVGLVNGTAFDPFLEATSDVRKSLIEECRVAFDMLISAAKEAPEKAKSSLRQLEVANQKSSNPLIVFLLPTPSSALGSHIKHLEKFGKFESAMD